MNIRILLGLLVGGLMVVQATAAEVVTLVDATGRTTTGATLTEWSGEQVVVQSDKLLVVPLDDLLSMTFQHDPLSLAAGDPLVILSNGDRLVARPVGVFEDMLTATWLRVASKPPLKIPLENIAAIIFDLPAAMDDRQRLYSDLQTMPSGEDVVLLANGDRVKGEFERLDGAFVQLKSPSGLLKVDRSRVQAIRINPDLTSTPKVEGRRQVITLRDGSRFTAKSVQLLDRELKCATFSKQDFLIPVADCQSCHVYGARVFPLSDREPAETLFAPYLSSQWSMMKNANVLRGPLALRGTTYSTGLGVHSRSSVTYQLDPQDREFRAIVGIDDSAGGKGSVRFSVELDGKRVWDSPELTGKSQPLSIRPISLAGAKKLTLIVDFGANADIADYADWCDAIVIR